MVKIGRPTSDPCSQITIFVPKSLLKSIRPIGDETRSKRIINLIRLGVKRENQLLKLSNKKKKTGRSKPANTTKNHLLKERSL